MLSVQGLRARHHDNPYPNTRNDCRVTAAGCGLATELKTAGDEA